MTTVQAGGVPIEIRAGRPTITPMDLPVARVALIRPPIVIYPKSLMSYGPVPPIGLAYIAAVLRDAGHEIQVIDSPGEAIEQFEDFDTSVGTMRRVGLSPREIIDRIHAGTDVIGLTHMFVQEWPQVREIAALARERFPEAVIILGGENATAFKRWIFDDCPAVDACVLGEGEATALELVNRVAEGRPLDGLGGLALRVANDEVADTGLSPRARKLSVIPRPAWDLFPLDNYWRYSDFFSINRGRSLPVMATRGCPYKCSFCSSPQMWTTRYVVREPEDVVDEIADYAERYGVENINFCDLTAITKRKWTLRFCDELEARNLDIVWQLPVGTRSEALDIEVLRRLAETGCKYVTYAPESGSERMLKIYDKRVDLDSMLESLANAHAVGLQTRVNIIIGHPAERWPDLWKSLKFLIRAALVGCDDVAAIMFCPYPGSADFEQLVESGRLTVDESSYYTGISRTSGHHTSYNDKLSSRQLRFAQLGMAATFYGLGVLRRPARLAEMIRAQRSGKELTFFDQFLRGKRRGFEALVDRPLLGQDAPAVHL